MQDYEALGSYLAAKKQAQKFAQERNRYLLNIRYEMERVLTRDDDFIATDFAAAKVQENLNKAAELHQNMLIAIAEANSQAEACGKPKLEILSK
jgi:hypothetical protein